MKSPRRNMLLGNNLQRTSQSSRDLASGLKLVRFAQFFQFPTVFKPAGKETKVGNDCLNRCWPFVVFFQVVSRVKRALPTWRELSFESLFLITHQQSKDPLGDKISDSLVSLTSGLSDFFAPRDSLNLLLQSRFCRSRSSSLPHCSRISIGNSDPGSSTSARALTKICSRLYAPTLTPVQRGAPLLSE